MYSILRCNAVWTLFSSQATPLRSSMSNSHIQTHSRNEQCANALQQTFSCYFLNARILLTAHWTHIYFLQFFFNERISDGKIPMNKNFNWKNSFLVKIAFKFEFILAAKKIQIQYETQQCTQSQTGGWMIWCRRYVL